MAVAGLFIGVARQAWAASTDDESVVRLEASGAEMMHSMTTLLDQVVTAQSAAVRGDAIDGESLQTALEQVREADRAYGADLRTSQRLTDLSAQIEATVSSGVTGAEAYAVWPSMVDLTVDLIHVIGDTAHLVRDPDLDSYYLVDAAIVHLPRTMVYAGRAADLVALADGEELTGSALLGVAIARFNVSLDAEQVLTGLTTSVDFTERSELGSSIAPRLDVFRSAADEFSPPTMLQELAAEVDAATMDDNASRVLTAAAQLSHLLLGELQALLEVRAGDIAQERRLTVTLSAAGAVLGTAVAALVLVSRPIRRRVEAGDEPITGARGFTAVAGASGELTGAGARSSGHAR
jgi:hypothetical protein